MTGRLGVRMHAMALLRRRKKTAPPEVSAGASAAADPDEHLTAYDPYGRAVSLTREEYRARVLPGAVRKNWENPPALYGAIVQGLRDNFADDLLEASERLLQ